MRKEMMPTFADQLEWQEMIIDFDPFSISQRGEGGIVRLSSSSLSNVSAAAA